MASAQNTTYNQYSNNAAPSDLPPAYDVRTVCYFMQQFVISLHFIFYFRLYHPTMTALIRRISDCYNTSSSKFQNIFLRNFLHNS